MNTVNDKSLRKLSEEKVTKKGTQIILDVLCEHGIREIFGYPGGCVIPLFDEFLNYPELEMILVRHEQAATHAAEGLARVTGKAQVCIATSGPGATNCVTGMANAMLDSIPMVVITGQVRRPLIGTDAFQETNVVGVSRPVTKHNYLVKDISVLRDTIREAFYIAETGRPGPVLVDIPVDLQRETLTFSPNQSPIKIKGYRFESVSNPNLNQQVNAAWKMIQEAKKPLLYIGGGVVNGNASDLLIEFARKTGIPVSTTLLGQGAFPEDDKLALGMLGMHGTYSANKAMMETDLSITIGARFDDRVTGKVDEFLKDAKIIHVDIDPSSLGKIKQADIPILAHCREFLSEINKIAAPLKITKWQNELEGYKAEFPTRNFDDVNTSLNLLRPEFVIKKLSELTDGNAVIVTDVGQHQMFTCLHYRFKNSRSHLTSGGLGTMGFSLPAAMGAAFHVTDRPVISISGDGGFQMNMQELATIRMYNIPVKIIILNNRNLGMVKQWQDFFWQNRYASTIFDFNPDFVRLAEAYDIPGKTCREKDQVVPDIKELLDAKGPMLLEFMIDKDAHVYPMIPSGEALKNIIVDPALKGN